MNTTELLHTNREEVRKAVLEELHKTETDVQNDIWLVKNWLQYQNHLPEQPCDRIIETFLIVNKFNLEKCKKKLERYYTIREEIPDLYADKNPKLVHMKNIANAVFIIPLPKLTPSLSRVTVMKLKDVDPEKFDALSYFAHSYNVLEIRIREDIVLTDTLIYDMKGIQLGHIFKLRFGLVRKAATVLEKVFSSRMEAIHYINLPNSMQMIVNIMKTCLQDKMRKRIHIHKDIESLHQQIPIEILPTDYGGFEASLSELHGLWLEKLEENQELFDRLETFGPKHNQLTSENMVNGGEYSDGDRNFRNICVD